VLRITVPVWKKGLGLQKINEVRICHEGNWAEKHLASLATAYRHAPYAREHIPFLETVFTRGYDRLVDLNWAVLHYLMTCLGMKTKMIRLSELNIRKGGDDLLIELCGELGASQFLAQGSAKKYLKRALFERAGVTLRFFNPPDWVYPQLWGSFISNLSTLDMLLNCGPKARDILFKHREDEV
jgi:hypothetical protein